MGRLRKKAAGKARAGTDFKSVPIMRRTLAYAATTKGEAQSSIRPLYEAVTVSFSVLDPNMLHMTLTSRTSPGAASIGYT